MPGVFVVGAPWGDEGKRKFSDGLTSQADSVVRVQWGNHNRQPRKVISIDETRVGKKNLIRVNPSPDNAKVYLQSSEKLCGISFSLISLSAEWEKTINRQDIFGKERIAA